MYHAEEQPQPDGADHEHERVPHDAERGLGNLQPQRVGLRVETAVWPDEPGGGTHDEEGGTEGGQVYEPQRREPERLGHGPAVVAGAEQYDGGHGLREWHSHCDG